MTWEFMWEGLWKSLGQLCAHGQVCPQSPLDPSSVGPAQPMPAPTLPPRPPVSVLGLGQDHIGFTAGKFPAHLEDGQYLSLCKDWQAG